MRTWPIYGHWALAQLVPGLWPDGPGHVPELGDTVLDPTSGSAQVGGPRMPGVLTQCEEGLLAA